MDATRTALEQKREKRLASASPSLAEEDAPIIDEEEYGLIQVPSALACLTLAYPTVDEEILT